MERQQLLEYIQQLNASLTDIKVSEQERQALLGLIQSIQAQLDDDEPEHPDTLAQQVDELASAFEAEHPTLTGILNNLMVTLTSMGV